MTTSPVRVVPNSGTPNEMEHNAGPMVSTWERVDLGPILRGEKVTPSPSVLARADGIRMLYPGRLNLFMGETESLKTWAADIAVVQELREDHHVIYVDFEDTPESAVERLQSLGAASEQIESGFSYYHPAGRFNDIAALSIEELISQNGALTLVVIDGVTEAMSMMDLDPGKGPDVAHFYSSFPRWLARTGAAVVLIDHVTKSTEGRGRWAIGSERKLSGLDGAAYAFTTIHQFGRGRTGTAKITVSKDRCGFVRQHEGSGRTIAVMELRSWPDGGVTFSLEAPELATKSDGTFRPIVLMEKASKAIEANPGLSKRALRTAVGSKHDHADLAIELLVIEGYAFIELGPNRSQRYNLRKPFRVSKEVE